MKKVLCSNSPLTLTQSKLPGSKWVCLVTLSLMLSACSILPAKKGTGSSVSSSTTNKAASTQSSQAAQAYIANKQSASQGIVIASTHNACVDGFNFLKGMNQNQFGLYSEDYNRINQNYTFLNTNKEIMDKDSKEMLSMTLNKKLDTLCTKVQYAGFIGVKDRIKELNAH